jgi:hypothetical protein
VAVIVLLGPVGCRSASIPPFYEQSFDEGEPMREGTREVTWDEEVGLHPIFEARHSEKDDRSEVHWLFPFGEHTRNGADSRTHVYPFYLHDVRTDPDGFQHDTTVCFPPGLFAGSHPVYGDFAYLFPFGGNMYGLFGKEKFVGVLFPLYGWTEDRGVETHHILFPLISWSSGGDEKATEEGFRILPFYSHSTRVANETGVAIHERTHILWPFFSMVYEGRNTKHPAESIFVFPFWGRTRSSTRDEDTVLWPLFRYVHDKDAHTEEWRAPFPFFWYGRGDGTPQGEGASRLDVWPIFGFRTRGGYERHFFLWPIERWERHETEDHVETDFWIVPFFFTRGSESKDEAHWWSERKTRVWPFVKYKRTREGGLEIAALSPLWFDDPNWNFETILDPLYRLFRWVERPDGATELDLLLGVFSSRQKADGSSRWDVFGGLFGHSTDKSGVGSVRLLWFLDL